MKRPIVVSVICVALTFVLLVWGFRFGETEQPTEPKTYALLIEEDTGAFVMQLRKGMQQAADEGGAQLAVYVSGEELPQAGLSGVILWLTDPDDEIERFEALKLPVVVVGQSRADVPCVLGDDESAGKQLMRYALSLESGDKVALVVDDGDEHDQARAEAAMLWGGFQNARVVSYGEDMALPEGCRVAVATSLRSTLLLRDMKQSGLFMGKVVGVDTDENRVEDLESGLICAMALDSPYAMGYLAMRAVQELAAGGKPTPRKSSVLLATPDNMYWAQNVKQVFPLLQ